MMVIAPPELIVIATGLLRRTDLAFVWSYIAMAFYVAYSSCPIDAKVVADRRVRRLAMNNYSLSQSLGGIGMPTPRVHRCGRDICFQ
jgi:hypothetical protein